MSTSLFFNLSFDLAGISLILFVIWFFVNFHNAAAAFKWFSLSILALLASVIILSYGSIKLSQVRSSLPRQNQTEITALKQKVASLKSGSSDYGSSASDQSKSHHKESASSPAVPSRIVNSQDNQIVKEAVSKHEHHINLVAKVTNPDQPLMVRGVHSSQNYELHDTDKSITAGEFVVIKGTATSVKDGTIELSINSIKKQA